MKTIIKPVSIIYTERNSRFLGYLYPVNSFKDVEEQLKQLKVEYPDANHHCYAYRLFPDKIHELAQDDGDQKLVYCVRSGDYAYYTPIQNKGKLIN